MIYLSNEPYPQEISVPRSFGVIVPHRNEYLSTADIATDLTTDSDTKVLAASQGVVLKEMVDAKADKSNTYTKAQVNSALALKANKADTYTKAQVDGALAEKQDELVAGENITIEGNVISATGGGSGDSYTRAETDALLAEKADADDVYTKSEVDTALAGKANANAVYTKGEVDAELADKQDVITDLATIRSGAAAGATAVQPAELSAGLATKQDTLVSGTNIKTINNESLLGSGNIVIQGGGGEPEVFWAEYGVTTAAEIDAAVTDGKEVVCKYSERLYRLSYFDPTSSVIYFGSLYESTSQYLMLRRANNTWSAGLMVLERDSNKKTDIAANKDSNTYYPTTKAVYNALGKYGVVSQTQTWTGSPSTGYTYTMSNQVWGLIPQANIDLYESAGAVFNETTGYFELNGLVDISYEEMKAIYTNSIGLVRAISSRSRSMTNYAQRAALPLASTASFGVSLSYMLYGANMLEILTIEKTRAAAADMSGMCQGANKLKAINGTIIVNSTGALTNTFKNCYSLESVALEALGGAVSFAESSLLTAASVAYMINKSNTSAAAFTITLHATAYARAIADADVQAALAAHTNVTLASN